jgi:hypothetical protein
MVFTHPEFELTSTPIEIQREMAAIGVLIEKDWVNIALGMVTSEYMAETIRQVGPEHIYLATDRGQADGERPAEGMLLYIECLLEQGISPKDIKTMIQTVPEQVLQ